MIVSVRFFDGVCIGTGVVRWGEMFVKMFREGGCVYIVIFVFVFFGIWRLGGVVVLGIYGLGLIFK